MSTASLTGMPLRHQVGQLFLVGLGGPSLDASERAWLRLLRPGGFILFRRNIEASAQATELLSNATEAAAGPREHIPAIRALDLEGGLVDRLRDLLSSIPSVAMVATFGSKRDAKRHGQLIGRATRLHGFNTTFAPVLDLALPASAPVLRTRVAGADPDAVTTYARAFLEGLRTERVLGCGKHFPGLGGGTLDSHHATPHILRTWDELWTEDLAPYRALLSNLPIIMVSHATYPRVRTVPLRSIKDEPASISRFWIAETLRRRMGYEGLVLTDDMEMGGLLTQISIEDASVAAIVAGSDLLEVCKDPALIFRAYEAVLAEAERSPVFRARIRRACVRVIDHKQQRLDALLPRTATPEQITRLRRDILLFTAELEATERARAAKPGP